MCTISDKYFLLPFIYLHRSQLERTTLIYAGIRPITLSSVQNKQHQGIPRKAATKLIFLLARAKLAHPGTVV